MLPLPSSKVFFLGLLEKHDTNRNTTAVSSPSLEIMSQKNKLGLNTVNPRLQKEPKAYKLQTYTGNKLINAPTCIYKNRNDLKPYLSHCAILYKRLLKMTENLNKYMYIYSSRNLKKLLK